MKENMKIYRTTLETQVAGKELKCNIVMYGDIINVGVFVDNQYKNTLHYCNFDGLYDIIDDIIDTAELPELNNLGLEEFDNWVEKLYNSYVETGKDVNELEQELKENN